MKKICIIFSLFISCLFSLSSVYASDTIINDMEVSAYINEDGSAHIQETWDMNINEGTEVYKVFKQMGTAEITDLKVSDETGLKYQNIGEWDVKASRNQKRGKCGLVTNSDGYELCFGVGDYGHRIYTFEYNISHFVNQYTSDQGINYAFLSDMSMDIKHIKVTVSSPYELNQDNSSIWGFGYHGDVVFKDGKVVMESNENVDAGYKVQLLMRIDDGLFVNTNEKNQSFEDVLTDAKEGSDYNNDSVESHPFLPFAVLGGALVAFVLTTWAVFFINAKTKKLKYTFNDHVDIHEKDVNMFRDIPCHKDVFEFYYLSKKAGLISDEDKGGLIAAILLRWIQKGFIEFEKREESHLLFFKKDGFSVDLDKEINIDYPLELDLLGFVRNAAGSNQKLETDEFENWCASHYKDVENWFDKIETGIETKYRSEGLLTIENTNTRYMGMKIERDRDVYDASIREKMEQIIGLKKFLTEMSLIDEKEVIEVKLWEEYLIFASVLGIADRVEEQLGKLCPTFNAQSDLDTIYTMNMVHMFAYSSMRASRNAQLQAQSARSGGFGGGASFGGGGGGFSGGGGGGVR